MNVEQLIADLNDLSANTWEKVESSVSHGFSFREESITEHNLFSLLKRQWKNLHIQKFNASQESVNGADFEWWIGGSSQGWVCLRFQAKKLNARTRRYEKLYHQERKGHRRQLDSLIASCKEDSRNFDAPIWPLVCFYNGWPVTEGELSWPSLVPALGCPKGVVPPGCEHATLYDYGCAVASAYDVVTVPSTKKVSRVSLEKHLCHSRPWSQMFGQIQQRGSERRFLGDVDLADPAAMQDSAPDSYSVTWETIASAVSRRMNLWFAEKSVDRMIRRVEPGPELPEYALKIMESRADRDGRPSRYPSAKFVVVLNAEG